jgi:hypothetical protein
VTERLSIGGTLDDVLSAYISGAAVLLPLSFCLFLVPAIVNHLPITPLAVFPIAFPVMAIATALFQGMIVLYLRAALSQNQTDAPIRKVMHSIRPMTFQLIAAGLLSGAAVVIGILLFVVPGLILLTIWAVVAPVIADERTGVFAAFGRSRYLVRHNAWRVFSVILVTGLVTYVAWFIFNGVASGLAGGSVIRIAFTAVTFTFTAPVGALAAGIMYFRLHALKEYSETLPQEPSTPPETLGPMTL